jgi:hypothetical protein
VRTVKSSDQPVTWVDALASSLSHCQTSGRPIYRKSLKSCPGGYNDPSEETSTLRSHELTLTDQAKSASRPSRRFLRFSVRGLIVLVLVIGAGLGWLVRSARIQREAVVAIVEDGGVVVYDWQESNGR